MPKLVNLTILLACVAAMTRGEPETGLDMIDQLLEEGTPSCLHLARTV